MKLPRRVVLRGLGGVALGLPFLESLGKERASAAVTDPFVIFVVHGNGVQQQSSREPERFWPRNPGLLDTANIGGLAVEELAAFQDRLLLVRGVDHGIRNRGDHTFGGGCLLTAQDAVSNGGGNRLAGGESLDWRIGRELNPAGREPTNLYAGPSQGYITTNLSYRGRADLRSPERNPLEAYQNLIGVTGRPSTAEQELLVRRRRSVNDVVRDHLQQVLRLPRLSQSDRTRITRHLEQVRDLELEMQGRLPPADEASLEESTQYFNDDARYLDVASLHMKVAALAVVSGASRAAVIQVGNGQDTTRYVVDGERQENFHWISHRAFHNTNSYDGNFPEAEMLHHKIDRMFLQRYRGLLDQLDTFGALDDGVAVWTNNLAEGPSHRMRNLPFILAGSCGGVLHQGRYVDAGGVDNNKILNTIGSAVGLRDGAGGPLTDFGDGRFAPGLIEAMIASRPWE